MTRSLVSIVVGTLTAIVLIGLIEWIGHQMYPPVEGLDPLDKAAMKAYLETAPPGAFAFVLLAYAVGTFVGTATTAHLAGKKALSHALLTGGILLALGLMNTLAIWHPGWFVAATCGVMVVATALGWRAGTQPLPGNHEGWIIKRIPDYSK